MLTRKLEEKSRELNQMKRNLEADLRREMEKNKRVLAEERLAKQVNMYVCVCVFVCVRETGKTGQCVFMWGRETDRTVKCVCMCEADRQNR